MNNLIDGRAIAEQTYTETVQRVTALKSRGVQPALAFVRVGEDPASKVYVGMKEKTSAKLGIASTTHVFAADTPEETLLEFLRGINANSDIHGILVQTPVPNHISQAKISSTISPEKDIDGFHPVNVGKLMLGELIGTPPGSMRSKPFSRLVSPFIRNLSAGPYIVDAWPIPSRLLANDANASTVGSTSIRVVWAGGITDYPTGNEVGDDVTRAYRLTYVYRGKTVTLAPLDLGDLNDGDNMHDLSFPAIPSGAKLRSISLPRRLVEDPNGDPNPAQRLRIR